MKKNNSQKGFTLIELLISLSILLIILSIIFSFYFFERKTFKKGEAQSIIQENVVLAAQFITNEIRNALEVSLEDGYEADTGYCFIFLEDSILKYDDGSGNVIDKTDAVIDQFKIELLDIGENYKIKFYIKGVYESQYYDISTEFVLNNVENAVPLSKKSIIRYKKP